MTRAVLVDDERLARKYLRQLLAEHPTIEIVGEADSVNDAAALCAREHPDLVFLDVRMPGDDGFELIGRVTPQPKVIFVTAFAEYAARAFDVQAVDYLLKPVTPERMRQALLRAGAVPGDAPSLAIGDSVCLRDGTQVVVAPLREIVAIEARADYTRVRFVRHAPMLVHRPMKEWETLLPEREFPRLDRSLFVNRAHIQRLEVPSRDAGLLHLEGQKTPLELGRSAVSRLRAHLSEG
jgi:two-component system LytT family response regulator